MKDAVLFVMCLLIEAERKKWQEAVAAKGQEIADLRARLRAAQACLRERPVFERRQWFYSSGTGWMCV